MTLSLRHRLWGFCAALICGLLVLAVYQRGLFERIEHIAVDTRFRLRGYDRPTGQVVVIGITSDCMKRYAGARAAHRTDRDGGGSAEDLRYWDRSSYAAALDRLSGQKAAVVVFDIFFDRPGDPLEDAELERAIAENGRVILPVWDRVRLNDSRTPDGMYQARNLAENLPRLTQRAAGIGHINALEDSDGKIRRVPATVMAGTHQIPQMGLAAASLYWNNAPVRITARSGSTRVRVARREAPLSQGCDLYVNYFQASNKAPIFYSFSQLLREEIPDGALTGKIVLVGQTEDGVRNADTLTTPLGKRFGVWLQYSMIESLMTGRFVWRDRSIRAWLSILGMAATSGVLLFTWRLRTTCILFATLLACTGALSIHLFGSTGFLVELAPVTATLSMSMGASLGMLALAARRRVVAGDLALRILEETGQEVNQALMAEPESNSTRLRIPGSLDFYSSLVIPDRAPVNLVQSICQSVGASFGTVYFRQDMDSQFDLVACSGLEDDSLRQGTVNLDRRVMQRIRRDGLPVLSANLSRDPEFRLVCPEAKSLLAVPLIINGIMAGSINLYNKRPSRMSPARRFDADDLRLVSTMAHQAAISLHNANLYDRVHDVFLSSIKSLAAAIDAKDPYTRGHSERVAKFSRELAIEIGLTTSEVEVVQLSALLHDIGKIGVHDSVLTKPGKLTDDEWQLFRLHPDRGTEIIAPMKSLSMLSPGIRHHHERFSGGGYPSGIAGEQIPLLARIIAIADAWDAMTSDRAYRPSLGHEKAVGQIVGGRGTQFDPALADAFLNQVLHTVPKQNAA